MDSFKVKIISCSNPEYWYSHLIGEVFSVRHLTREESDKYVKDEDKEVRYFVVSPKMYVISLINSRDTVLYSDRDEQMNLAEEIIAVLEKARLTKDYHNPWMVNGILNAIVEGCPDSEKIITRDIDKWANEMWDS